MDDRIASSRGVFVLGMHRSGTSALTRVLNLLGFYLGDSLLGARESNAFGHWEPVPVIELNERVQAALGRTWSDPREMDSDWLHHASVQSLIPEASLLLERDYRSHHFWSIKDPRISRLLPFWLQANGNAKESASAVIAARHPWEVASSLHRRDGLPLSQGLLLWWQHTSEALLNSRGLRRVIVSYEDLLRDWHAEVERIAEALELPLSPAGQEEGVRAIQQFLDPRARHEVHDASKHPVPPVLEDFYASLCKARDPEALDQLEASIQQVRHDVECHAGALADVYIHRERLHHRVVELETPALDGEVRAHGMRHSELTRQMQTFSEHLSRADWVNSELDRKCRETESKFQALQTDYRVEFEQHRNRLERAERVASTERTKREQLEEALRSLRVEYDGEVERSRVALLRMQKNAEEERRSRSTLEETLIALQNRYCVEREKNELLQSRLDEFAEEQLKRREAEVALDALKAHHHAHLERIAVQLDGMTRLQADNDRLHREKDALQAENGKLYAQCREQHLLNEQLCAKHDVLTRRWYVRMGQMLRN